MNLRSFLYRPLTPAEMQEVCRYYLGKAPSCVQLLEGGLFHTTYCVEVAGQKTVLRLGPVNRHRLLPYEMHLMEAEAELLGVLSCHGIPTSSLLVCDTGHAVLERDLMLVKCLPAVSLAVGNYTLETKAHITQQVGELTRKIHGITATELPHQPKRPFGRYASIVAGRGASSWREAILQEVTEWRDCAAQCDLFPSEILARVEACYRRFSPLLDQVGQTPHLIHADLWHGNVLVGAGGSLAALIDCDRALFGDPEFEFATGWMIDSSFQTGYGRGPDGRPEARLRRRLYRLMLELEDCYILREEYNLPQESQNTAARVLEELAQLEAVSED